MTPDLQRVLGLYVGRGWANANHSGVSDEVFGNGRLRPAYLLLSSGMTIQPLSEFQVTTRCYRPFRAHKMIVAEDSGRFNLTDLKVGNRSQFARAQDIPLRAYVALVRGARQEAQPDLIRWPLETCTYGSEVSVRAIIPEGHEEDPGTEFEIVLLGEAVF